MCLQDINIEIFVQGEGMTWDQMHKLKEIKGTLQILKGIRRAVQLDLKVKDKALDKEVNQTRTGHFMRFRAMDMITRLKEEANADGHCVAQD